MDIRAVIFVFSVLCSTYCTAFALPLEEQLEEIRDIQLLEDIIEALKVEAQTVKQQAESHLSRLQNDLNLGSLKNPRNAVGAPQEATAEAINKKWFWDKLFGKVKNKVDSLAEDAESQLKNKIDILTESAASNEETAGSESIEVQYVNNQATDTITETEDGVSDGNTVRSNTADDLHEDTTRQDFHTGTSDEFTAAVSSFDDLTAAVSSFDDLTAAVASFDDFTAGVASFDDNEFTDLVQSVKVQAANRKQPPRTDADVSVELKQSDDIVLETSEDETLSEDGSGDETSLVKVHILEVNGSDAADTDETDSSGELVDAAERMESGDGEVGDDREQDEIRESNTEQTKRDTMVQEIRDLIAQIGAMRAHISKFVNELSMLEQTLEQ